MILVCSNVAVDQTQLTGCLVQINVMPVIGVLTLEITITKKRKFERLATANSRTDKETNCKFESRGFKSLEPEREVAVLQKRVLTMQL